jgi:hypothetical protein
LNGIWGHFVGINGSGNAPLPGTFPDGVEEKGSGADELRQALGKLSVQSDLPLLVELADLDTRKARR